MPLEEGDWVDVQPEEVRGGRLVGIRAEEVEGKRTTVVVPVKYIVSRSRRQAADRRERQSEGFRSFLRSPLMLQVDGDGIPVLSAISRSSSGCILDAPGSVQVGLGGRVGWVVPAIRQVQQRLHP